MQARRILASLLTIIACAEGQAQVALASETLDEALLQAYGRNVTQAGTKDVSDLPRYLLLRQADGQKVSLVVPVFMERAWPDLAARKVRVISRYGAESFEKPLGQACLGIAVIRDWRPQLNLSPNQVFMGYECMSGIVKVAVGSGLHRTVLPRAQGESVLLTLESGAQTLLYWDGSNYRFQNTRPGD